MVIAVAMAIFIINSLRTTAAQEEEGLHQVRQTWSNCALLGVSRPL